MPLTCGTDELGFLQGESKVWSEASSLLSVAKVQQLCSARTQGPRLHRHPSLTPKQKAPSGFTVGAREGGIC